MELGLIRIVGALGQFIGRGPIEVGRTDRVVVPELAVSLRDDFKPLLTVNDVFHRGTNMIVVVG